MIRCPFVAKENPSGTRQQILEAARAALARDGYEKITTRRIAQEAGVNIATLHYYFGTKEALLTETMRYSVEWVQGQIHAAALDAPNLGVALDRAFTAALDVVRNNPGILRYDLVIRGFRDDGARIEAQQFYTSYVAFSESLFQAHLAQGKTLSPEVSITTLARYLTCAIDGVILHYMTFHDETAAHESLSLIRDHILRLVNSNTEAEP